MFRKVTLFTLFLALIVITLDAYVRYLDAGLGCPDWHGCYGKAIVVNDAEFKAQAEINFPESPLNTSKAWKEMTYRYVCGFLGVFILILALASLAQKQCRSAVIISTISLLMLFGLQSVLGMWAVKMKLMPVIVTGHMATGFITFWLISWLYLRVHPKIVWTQQSTQLGPGVLTRFAMLILFLQIILGGWTSTNLATLACTDFPRCNGAWMPAVDYLSALNLFSGLMNGYSGVLSFDGQIAAHWMHRLGAVISFIVLTMVVMSATSENYSKPVQKAGVTLSFLLLVQITLGIFSVKLQNPLWIAIAHNAFSALLMLPLVAISFFSKYTFIEDSKSVVTVDVIDVQVETNTKESYVEPTATSLYLRLTTQLKKTRTELGGVLSGISLGKKGIDKGLLEEIESSLLMADLGIEATSDIISQLTEKLAQHQLNDSEALETSLKEILLEILQPCCQPLRIPVQDGPFVILVVGINGVGKTTSIGKLARQLQAQGQSVMLAAGDTFRAAAVEQLEAWGERNNIHVVAQHTGADSASVIFDGVQSALAKGVDVLIADTAGRLHTKSNLMEELSKIKRIIRKLDETAPHEVLLVLDAGTGQNALSQTKTFNETVELTGLALTKLDGTAKGGVIFAVAKQFGLPVRFIGIGEGIDDLQDFDAQSFVNALFVKD